MKLFRFAAIVAALLLLAPATPARAMGFGAFFEYANVFDAELETDFGDIEYEEDHYAVGFTLDTNVASDRLFNYRLDIGYEHVDGQYNGFDENGDGLMIDNSFGFGVVRDRNVRLWVGPAVRLSVDDFDESDVVDFGIGVGPAVGVNFHTAATMTLSLSAGYQILYVLSSPDHGEDEDGYEQIAFVRIAAMFRTADDNVVH